MQLEENDLHRLFACTMQRLDVLRKRVRQGFQVGEANDFARYVMMSGMVSVMRLSPPRSARLGQLFPYSGDELFKAADDLRQCCGMYYAARTKDTEGTAAGPDASDIEGIEAKLNQLLALHGAPLAAKVAA